MATLVFEQSMELSAGGKSQSVAMSTTSAASTAISKSGYIVVYVSADCFARKGVAPTALINGTDQFLVGGNQYRFPWTDGEKIAFITVTGTGTAYITPGV